LKLNSAAFAQHTKTPRLHVGRFFCLTRQIDSTRASASEANRPSYSIRTVNTHHE
jgi:hypothetical protein